MKRALRFSVPALLLFLLAACSKSPDPNKVGIFCSSPAGLQQLIVFAEDNGMGVVKITGADAVDAVPKLSSVDEFLVNVPGAAIANAKVYWPIRYGDRGTDFSGRPYQVLNIKSASALPVTIELVKGNMYKVACKALKDKSEGLAALEIDRRFYMIDLGASEPIAARAAMSTAPAAIASPSPVPRTLASVPLLGQGTYVAMARDESTMYALQLWRDSSTNELVGWITHGGGCNDPIGRLEDVHSADTSLAFTARLHKEDLSFTGTLSSDTIEGDMHSTRADVDLQGNPVADTWRIEFKRESTTYKNDYDSRALWEEEMTKALKCCGPSVTEITPCR